jgi:hypothetical protein
VRYYIPVPQAADGLAEEKPVHLTLFFVEFLRDETGEAFDLLRVIRPEAGEESAGFFDLAILPERGWISPQASTRESLPILIFPPNHSFLISPLSRDIPAFLPFLAKTRYFHHNVY